MIRLTRDQLVYRFSGDYQPAAYAKPGDQIFFETEDSHTGTVPEGPIGADVDFPELNIDNANPITGLVHVEGAEPGDTLVVKILRIDLVGQGFICARPKGGIVYDMTDHPTARVVHIKDGRWYLNERWSFPIDPMVGVIGTAVPGAGIAPLYVGDHGGNMDNKLVKTGATVYLPVNVPGALFGLGDVHASMGDGEATSAGVDIKADVTVEINLIKGGGLSRFPYIEVDGKLVFCGHGPDFETAITSVTKETIRILSEQMKITPLEAYQLISGLGDVNIAQASCRHAKVDITTRVSVPLACIGK